MINVKQIIKKILGTLYIRDLYDVYCYLFGFIPSGIWYFIMENIYIAILLLINSFLITWIIKCQLFVHKQLDNILLFTSYSQIIKDKLIIKSVVPRFDEVTKQVRLEYTICNCSSVLMEYTIIAEKTKFVVNANSTKISKDSVGYITPYACITASSIPVHIDVDNTKNLIISITSTITLSYRCNSVENYFLTNNYNIQLQLDPEIKVLLKVDGEDFNSVAYVAY